MSLQVYLLFVAASLLLVLTPGPDMAYMLSRTIAQGRRAGNMAALGINAGSYVHIAAAVSGLSGLLLVSATAFTVVKWAGAAYLCVLGIRALFGPQALIDLSDGDGTRRTSAAIFWQGFWSDVLNPKVAIFCVALLPQFIDAHVGHPTLQLMLLGVTGNMLSIGVNLGLVAVAARLSGRLRRSARIAFWLQRAMGMLFIGLGARLAAQTA